MEARTMSAPAQPSVTSVKSPIQLRGISLVIPAYNEEECITRAIEEAYQALMQLQVDFEILIVDDGSTDRTASIVQELQSLYPQLHLLQQVTNQGYGAALRRGFQAATKEFTAFTDADCQFDLNELKRLIDRIDDCDLVCGIRTDRQDPFRRILYSKTYNHIVRFLLGTQVRDCDCALKLFRSSVLKKLTISTNGFLVNAELLSQMKAKELRIQEVGVTHRPRLAGNSKVSIWHVIPVLIHLARFWWSSIQFPSAFQSQSSERVQWSSKRQWGMGLVLAFLAGAMFFVNIGYPMVEPDESRYAQIALEMVQTGNWGMPTLSSIPYLDKPPMLYWVTAVSYEAFGASPWSTRFPIAMASWLTVLAIYVLGIKILGDRTAWIGALLTLFCTGYIIASRFLIMDGLLTLFTTLSYLAIVRGLHSPRSMAWWTAAGLFAGLGVLTKGPIGLILCLPPAIACAALSTHVHLPRWKSFAAFFATCAAVSLPWFVWIANQQNEFAVYFFWKHNVVRFFHAFNHREPFWYYVPIIVGGLFPVTLMMPMVCSYFMDRREATRERRVSELGFIAAAGIWVVLFFSISSCKLPTYILPAIPWITMVCGFVFEEVAFAGKGREWLGRFLNRSSQFVAALTIPGALGIGLADAWFAQSITAPGMLLAGLTLVGLLLWQFRFKYTPSWNHRPWQIAAVACFVVGPFSVWQTYPQFATWRSSLNRVANLAAAQEKGLPVVFLGRVGNGADLVLKDTPKEVMSIEEMARFYKFMEQNPKAIILASEDAVSQIRQDNPTHLKFTPTPKDANLMVAENVLMTASKGSSSGPTIERK